MDNVETSIKSPCRRNCCLNQEDVCLGCGRSIDEITGWQRASNSQRQQILIDSRQRLAELKKQR
jgi:predicted Fe-S protein YdhL (DUF1289 family)